MKTIKIDLIFALMMLGAIVFVLTTHRAIAQGFENKIRIVDATTDYIELNWHASLKDASEFALQRRIPGHTWRTILTGDIEDSERIAVQHRDTPLTPGQVFCYRAIAVRDRAPSFSNQACAMSGKIPAVAEMRKLPPFMDVRVKLELIKNDFGPGTFVDCIDPELTEAIIEAMDRLGENAPPHLKKLLDTSGCTGGGWGWGLGDIWDFLEEAGPKVKKTLECAGRGGVLVLGCGIDIGLLLSCLLVPIESDDDDAIDALCWISLIEHAEGCDADSAEDACKVLPMCQAAVEGFAENCVDEPHT